MIRILMSQRVVSLARYLWTDHEQAFPINLIIPDTSGHLSMLRKTTVFTKSGMQKAWSVPYLWQGLVSLLMRQSITKTRPNIISIPSCLGYFAKIEWSSVTEDNIEEAVPFHLVDHSYWCKWTYKRSNANFNNVPITQPKLWGPVPGYRPCNLVSYRTWQTTILVEYAQSLEDVCNQPCKRSSSKGAGETPSINIQSKWSQYNQRRHLHLRQLCLC